VSIFGNVKSSASLEVCRLLASGEANKETLENARVINNNFFMFIINLP